MKTCSDVMTKDPICCLPGDTVEQVARLMKQGDIGSVPVVESHESGHLVGIVTDRDIRRILGPDFSHSSPETLIVGDAMVEEAYVVDLNTPLAVVLHHMADHHFGSALVTRKGKLAGVFTSTDACRAFAAHLDTHFHPPGEDAAA